MSLFGTLFGDSKDADPGRGSAELAEISRNLLSESAPLRSNLINRYSAFTSGGGLSPQEQQELSMLQGIQTNSTGGSSEGFQQALDNLAAETEAKTGIHLNDQERLAAAPDWLRHMYGGGQVGLTDSQRSRMDWLNGRLENPGSPGGFDVTNSPQFASMKDAINRQFSIAKNNVLATSTPGGSLSAALSNLEGQRASTTATGIGDLTEKEMARAFALGTGTTPTALGGLGSAAGISGNIAAAQAAQQGQAMSGLGYGIGSTMGRKGSSSATTSGSKGASTAAV